RHVVGRPERDPVVERLGHHHVRVARVALRIQINVEPDQIERLYGPGNVDVVGHHRVARILRARIFAIRDRGVEARGRLRVHRDRYHAAAPVDANLGDGHMAQAVGGRVALGFERGRGRARDQPVAVPVAAGQRGRRLLADAAGLAGRAHAGGLAHVAGAGQAAVTVTGAALEAPIDARRALIQAHAPRVARTARVARVVAAALLGAVTAHPAAAAGLVGRDAALAGRAGALVLHVGTGRAHHARARRPDVGHRAGSVVAR